MNDFSEDTMRSTTRSRLILLLGFHIVACCVSLIIVAEFFSIHKMAWFDKAHLFTAVPIVGLFALVAILFVFCRFSFGYLLGFYFYTMILGYLWLAQFSKFQYDHTVASISAFVSALAFLVPALFITSPIRQRLVLSARQFDHLLSGILILAAVVIASGAFYNFRLVSPTEIYDFREQLLFPGWLRYAIAITSNSLLPFAFACFVARGNLLRAAAVLLLLLLFYPLTLSKLVLFASLWLLFLALLFRFFEARTSAVLSLSLPVSAGIILAWLVNTGVLPGAPFSYFFNTINLRMIAYPSIALDVYNDFFSRQDYTYFCQIQFLKPFVDCPYNDFLSVMMSKAYQLGNLNASLFATEGIASVGPIAAPLAVFACGLVIALANRLSSGLPPKFILLSGGIVVHVFLNVPLTTSLLTGGAAVLFLLWYITPRVMFEQDAGEQTTVAHQT